MLPCWKCLLVIVNGLACPVCFIFVYLPTILLVLASYSCVGQTLPPPGPGPPPPGLPIDAGVLLGLVIGIIYGGKKLLKR